MRYAHLRIGSGAVTVAYEYNQEEGHEGERTLTAGLAFCAPNDRFNKKVGIKIAEGRYNSDNVVVIPLLEDGFKASIENHILSAINPIELAQENRFDDSLLAPRWLQWDVLNEFAYQLNQSMHQVREHKCSDEGCCDVQD